MPATKITQDYAALGVPAAINVDGGPGDICRFRTSEERNQGRHLVWLTVAAESRETTHEVRVLSVIGIHEGSNWSRLNDIHQDVSGRKIFGSTPCEACNGSHAGVINAETGGRGAFTEDAADIDDAATVRH